MDQTEAELDFCADDLHHQIDEPGHEMPALHEDDALETPVELSSHCDEAEYGKLLQRSPDTVDASLSFSSCDIAQVPEPAGEVVLTEEVSASMASDIASMNAVDDTVVVETGDAGGIVVDEDSTMTVEVVNSGPVKRKRGRPRKNLEAKATPLVRKKEREDVCFVCFDRRDPNLVACNRRGCYKAYHPACVNRDDAIFRSKGKWNCGCHICSTCQKAAHYMCYICTTSYCKECVIRESKYVCVRGTYGFCQSCHNTVTLIELNKLDFENKDGSDFDDTESFTYLFKAYWLDRKEKLSLTSEELNNAKHPYSVAPDEDSSDELYDVNEDQDSSSDSSSDHKINISSKKKVRGRSQAFAVDKNPPKEVGGGTVILQDIGWASTELLELVAHMRNGDQSFISQFDVQALLLDYIKKYNLRDPRRKSQIICDLRLRNLFGKERVGHFEMLKLLESHFLSKEAPQVAVDGIQVETSDMDNNNKPTDDIEDDTFARVVPEKRRKNRRRTEEIELQTNVHDYAAIDVHNITYIFLRRSLLEDLLEDVETFNDKVVGSFVRIRISNAGQRQDLYRLVQIVGTQESSQPYKVGKKTTDIVLEILNLNKKETSTIDSISNQDFTEEECQRLRQSIKCGLIDRLKVGYIQDKAKVLHYVRVNDSIETEKLRLSHLRDRASETGRRKELRECVEKLQLLNNPEERRRRFNELPQIHADPKMDPEYESSEEGEDDRNQEYQTRSREVPSLSKRRELIPRGRAGTVGNNNWNGMHKSPNVNRESWQDRSDMYINLAERPNEFLLNQSKEIYQNDANFTGHLTPSPGNNAPKSLGHQSHGSAPEINFASPEEADKIWHYQDPSMNIQGPFSISQLRKWNTTGYFPPDMRIWRAFEKQEDSIFLADVLAGRFHKDPHHPTPYTGGPMYNNNSPYQAPIYQEAGRRENGGGWKGQPDYGNIWSPMRPMAGMQSEIPKVEENLMLDPSIVVSAIPSADELNGRTNKYKSYENDCPSPTPKTERNESFLRQDEPGPAKNWNSTTAVGNMVVHHGTLDSSLVSHPAIINFESSNTASSVGLTDKIPGHPMQKADNTKSVSSEFQNNLTPISATTDGSGFQVMHHASVQKQFPDSSSFAPSLHGMAHDQSTNPMPNYSPIHQVNPQNAGEVESSLPSPTPKSTNVSVQNPNAPWGGTPQGNAGWGAPTQVNTTVNTGWGTVMTNANTGWGAPPQANTNANICWGVSVPLNPNTNTGWGVPAPGNADTNTGWGAVPVPQGNGDAMPSYDNDASVRAGWGPAYGSRNVGWKSMDRDTTRRFDHEGRNGDSYSRHRDRDAGNRGGRGGLLWSHQASSGGGDGPRGVCKFYESGHCKKGRSCKYLHTDLRRDI